ncbi:MULTISPECIES: YbhB/YbcL family Raf kinase inhibitor-like protein [unclassified Bradyrhizobium]|uniref:YbhB/YbcL family Raf kinase inhibitor-like protein n=1 Tax=unclassified Bradyrhizobium TaxID=2631580 RepID=UPI00291638E8|nr:MULTISPECIES: YbhB/YbcL family Raf kinase inhibitor-like protein [unclassified Bradyrhizobium]
MKLASSAFADGSSLPQRFTCDGENISPPLQWSGVPSTARSLVLLCSDPDAPAGTWHHWTVYDLLPDQAGLAEGAAQAGNLKQALNDFKTIGYGGPCPPRGHGVHHYHFQLLALSTDHLKVHPGTSCREVAHKARQFTLAETTLIGTYRR